MPSRAVILDVLSENLRTVLEDSLNAEISERKSLSDYGADSLETTEVISRTMKQLGAKVPRTELSSVDKIGELVTLIENSGSAGES